MPDGTGSHPAITMAHGFAGVKEHGLDRFASLFADAGFVVLVHDHRGFALPSRAARRASTSTHGSRSPTGVGPSLFWKTTQRWIRTGSVCGAPGCAGGDPIVLGAATDRRVRVVRVTPRCRPSAATNRAFAGCRPSKCPRWRRPSSMTSGADTAASQPPRRPW